MEIKTTIRYCDYLLKQLKLEKPIKGSVGKDMKEMELP